MRSTTASCLLGLGLGLACGLGSASAKDGPTPPSPSADVVPSEPQQTSATFGDWVVRCDRSAQTGGKRLCEVAQSLVVKGQQGPIAQIALGRAPHESGADFALTLTVLLPVNIAFDKPPKLDPGSDDTGSATLTFRRCVPGGCLADAKLTAAMMKEIRAATKPGHLSFTDASERTLTLPISFRGLAQALDDLAKEAG